MIVYWLLTVYLLGGSPTNTVTIHPTRAACEQAKALQYVPGKNIAFCDYSLRRRR